MGILGVIYFTYEFDKHGGDNFSLPPNPSLSPNPDAHKPILGKARAISRARMGSSRVPPSRCKQTTTTLEECISQTTGNVISSSFECKEPCLHDGAQSRGTCRSCSNNGEMTSADFWQTCFEDLSSSPAGVHNVGISRSAEEIPCPPYTPTSSKWTYHKNVSWPNGGFSDRSTCPLNSGGMPDCEFPTKTDSLACATECFSSSGNEIAQIIDGKCICRGNFLQDQIDKPGWNQVWEGQCMDSNTKSPVQFWSVDDNIEYSKPPKFECKVGLGGRYYCRSSGKNQKCSPEFDMIGTSQCVTGFNPHPSCGPASTDPDSQCYNTQRNTIRWNPVPTASEATSNQPYDCIPSKIRTSI